MILFNKFAMAKLSLLAGIIALAACSESNSPDTDHNHEQPESAHNHSGQTGSSPEISNRVSIPDNVRKNLGITFATVEKRAVQRTLRIPGEFEYLPQAQRHYHMNLEGVVELKVDALQKVNKGDLLYTLQSPRWQELKQQLLAIANDIHSAETTLRLSGGNTKPRVAKAARQRQKLLIEIASLYTGLSAAQLTKTVHQGGDEVPYWQLIDQIEVRSLSDGYADTFEVTNGEWANVGDRVFTVIDPTKLRFKAHALQRDVPLLNEGDKVTIVAPEASGVHMQETISGVLSLGVGTENDNRQYTVYASLDSLPGWARAGIGSYLEITLEGNTRKKLAIPKSAIVRDGLVDVFFRRDPNDPDKVIRTEADLGTDDGRWVVVNSGLRKGDQVVIDGAYELNIASSLAGVDLSGGHFHADGTFCTDHNH